PKKILKAAHLKEGQIVLEIGCGPGFFTLPAAEIVGEKGVIYALDFHPLAIQRVQEKVKQAGLNNVKLLLKDAEETGLPESHVDLVFIFDVVHKLDSKFQRILVEIKRILKPHGILSIKKGHLPKKKLLLVLSSLDFKFIEIKKGIMVFQNQK
ncbi:MAG: class I SAM-dependent methyltransferase, partial [Candidatus Heimdallarchaeaceae archaeon]